MFVCVVVLGYSFMHFWTEIFSFSLAHFLHKFSTYGNTTVLVTDSDEIMAASSCAGSANQTKLNCLTGIGLTACAGTGVCIFCVLEFDDSAEPCENMINSCDSQRTAQEQLLQVNPRDAAVFDNQVEVTGIG